MADDFLNDDDIIDLTELIEKGKDPADSLTPLAEEGPAEEGSDKDAVTDLDALLAEIDAKENPPEEITPEQAQSPEHQVDPQEKLDMGGMDQVDKLLDNLDIPQQPGPQAAAPQAAPAAELDNAVDALLKSATPEDKPAPEAAPAPETPPVPDLDEDLNAILAAVDGPGASAAPDDDMPSAEQLANPSSGLDALLAGMTAPAPEPAAAPAAAAAPADDLDALLASVDQMGAPAPEPVAEPAPAAAPAADAMDDLDAMMAAAQAATPEPVAEPAPAAAPAADPMDDLDAMMADAEAPKKALTRAPRINVQQMPKPVSAAPMPDLTPHPAPEDIMAEAAPEAPVADEPMPDVMPDMDMADLAAEVPAEIPADMPEEAAVTDAMPTEDMGVVMDEPLPDMPDMSETGMPEAEMPELDMPAAESMADLPDVEDTAIEEPAFEPAPETDMPAAPMAAPVATPPADHSASFEELLDEGSPLHDRFAALIASAVTTALHDNAASLVPPQPQAPAVDMESVNALQSRLDAIEQRLDQLAAASEAATANTGGDETLANQVQEVEISTKSLAARMDSLEQRLDNLEPRFNEQVEKAAANAAARILREEIARLLEA